MIERSRYRFFIPLLRGSFPFHIFFFFSGILAFLLCIFFFLLEILGFSHGYGISDTHPSSYS